MGLKGIRERRKLSQAELARLSGVGQGKISMIESGALVAITVQTALRLARALGVSVEELVATPRRGARRKR
jgi:transcriptional regulator with XRE-family HTH domain